MYERLANAVRHCGSILSNCESNFCSHKKTTSFIIFYECSDAKTLDFRNSVISEFLQ